MKGDCKVKCKICSRYCKELYLHEVCEGVYQGCNGDIHCSFFKDLLANEFILFIKNKFPKRYIIWKLTK